MDQRRGTEPAATPEMSICTACGRLVEAGGTHPCQQIQIAVLKEEVAAQARAIGLLSQQLQYLPARAGIPLPPPPPTINLG